VGEREEKRQLRRKTERKKGVWKRYGKHKYRGSRKKILRGGDTVRNDTSSRAKE
jgi:hypothetical protein